MNYFRGRGVILWALMVSLGVHVLVFSFFSFVRLSGGGVEERSSSVPAAVIQKITAADVVVPKPKIKRFEGESERNKRAIEYDLNERVKNDYSFETQTPVFDAGAEKAVEYVEPVTEFFGSTTELRKICYVVDGSGSMQGTLSMVRGQLTDSIAKLKPDQYFYIIIFQGERLVESGQGRLVRATPKAKAKANEFINRIRFQGPTNALNAIRRAMEIKDFSGNGAEQIYFLSDGFDLEGNTTSDFASVIENMRQSLAPAARINTIGFWVEEDDIAILKAIAADSGGEFVNVR